MSDASGLGLPRTHARPPRESRLGAAPPGFGRFSPAATFGFAQAYPAMHDDREDVYSKAVRAGKRTYFFDVKSTRGRDLFLTITESKKHTHEDGSAHYDKHKIFLYKEDFEKFIDGLRDAIGEIDRLRASGEYGNGAEQPPRENPADAPPFSDVNFEDLDRKDI
jgi:hypothetical protein